MSATPSARPDRRDALRTALAGAAVALAAVLAYLPSRDAYFLGDDFGLIHVLHAKPLRHFFSLFTGSWTDDAYGVRPDELRPFIALGYQVDSLSGAASPRAYHAGSIAYHAACSLLVFALARVAARATWPAALVGGLFFAWHAAHSEAVAWISGRADSIPTLFYLATLLAYVAWRARPRAWLYAAALASFFCALFSKQSAITMPALLAAYELLVERRRGRPLGRRLAPIVPFAALTAGYLALRQVLFGNFVREQLLTTRMFGTFLRRQAAYVDALLSPAAVTAEDLTTRGAALLALAIAATAALAWTAWRETAPSPEGNTLALFGPAWYAITIGPLIVTYFSARHLYLASAGLAIALAALVDRLGRRGSAWRAGTLAACAALLAAHLVGLQAHNRCWNDAARASRALAQEVHRVARSAPPGSLVVVDAPWRNRHAYVWAWAFPFVMQPPFAKEGLTGRVQAVTNHWAYCCPQEAWLRDLRQQVDAWSVRAAPAYVVALDASGGRAFSVADVRAPGLRDALRAVSGAPTVDAAQARLQHAYALARPPGR